MSSSLINTPIVTLGQKQKQINKFFADIDNKFLKSNTINTSELIKDLPKELKTDAKLLFLSKFDKTITKKNFIKFLCYMTYSGDYVSIAYLSKYFKMKTSNVNNIIVPNLQFAYRKIKQGAFYLDYILSIIKNDTFLNKYINTPNLVYLREDAIEANILPLKSNFKYDLAFIHLKILIEINEYAHERDEVKENDTIKKSLTVLCGYDLVTLRVSKVFDMSEIEFNKLTDIQIHEILKNSIYLKEFVKYFKNKIIAALLTCDNISDDFLMHCFTSMLNKKKQTITNRMQKQIITNSNLLLVLQNSNNVKDITSVNAYNKMCDYIDASNNLIIDVNTILTGLQKNTDIIDIFKIKNRCSLSKNPSSEIKFTDISKILKIKSTDTIEILIFKEFLLMYTDIIDDIDINIDNIRMSWENFSEIISNFSTIDDFKKILELYYREVGRSYDLIISMIKSHTANITGNKNILNTYTTHVNKKLENENKNLLLDIKMLQAKNEMQCKQYAKEVAFYKKEYDLIYIKHNTTYAVWQFEPIEPIAIVEDINANDAKTIIDAYLARIKNTDDDDLINKINKLEIVNDDDELE